ncbi:disease resistance protein Pik-2 isoform X2 [Triticum aestivum]|uniref:disease resistance protein Pik-2 isoform X2 n=1 Tax=Triticum aestivum TaxID=4565 RepID=UPI001D02174E|nr:disease resistance protein Pik-2-like isoform X2 [Triticum aestivum]
MDHATGAMGSLLLKLGKLLKEEYDLQRGIKEDIQYLERELESMQAALRKVGDVPRDQLDEQVKLWANEVKDLSYRMEDIIDKFLVRVEGPEPDDKQHKLKQLIKKMGDLFTKGKPSHVIAKEIKSMKARVQGAADRRDRYRVHEVVANPVGATTVDPRLLALYKDRKELVGIDDSMNELTKKLSVGDGDVSKQLKILSVFGFGGLGKTTLAKAVYNKIRSQFDCGAFVPVGRNPSLKNILNDVLLEIDGQKHDNLDERQLINKLQGLLREKRYIIVIDDIWETKTWEIVRCIFVHNNLGSKIITTTRIHEVAAKAGEIYKIKPLSHALSEELFCTRLFYGRNVCTSDQPEEAYNKILQKCGGVPLAIITIASLLVGKPVEVWSKVYNSIGFGHEDNEDVDNTRKIVLFSYYALPCHLRTCLLYMSQYREDSYILKDSLISRWVGEGFVQEEQGAGLFEIAERYFNELVNKSILQPAEILHHGIISHCSVHDMVLDMVRLLAKEENFLTIVDSHEQQTYPVYRNIRRLAIRNKNRLVDTHMPQFLRVLSLAGGISYIDTTNHLERLGKLVHLRYLGLAQMNIHELPKEIGDLKFLHTLDFLEVRLQELPQSVGQLSRLKCLWLEATNTRVPDWIGNLTSLEMLCVNSVEDSSNFVNEIGKLAELRKLRIGGSLCLPSAAMAKAWAESLVKLQKIQVIDIACIESGGYDDVTCSWEGYALSRQLRVLHLSYRQPGLLARINPLLLPSLSNLEVHVDAPDLQIFGMFPELVTLKLNTPIGLHHNAMGAVGAFPKLRVFTTRGTPGRFVKGDMPCLEHLEFRINFVQESNLEFDFASLVNLPLLQKVKAYIVHDPAIVPRADLHKAVEVARHAINILPDPSILDFFAMPISSD